MKNFKLLLATTAILSTALVMNTMALESNQAEVPVKAELISPISVFVKQGLDFGFLSHSDSGQTNIVATISNTNTIEGADYFTTPKRAILQTYNSSPVLFSFPEEVELYYTSGAQSQASYPSSKPTITLSNIHVIDSTTSQGSAYTVRETEVGGTLTINKGSAMITDGKIEGSFVVTAFVQGVTY